MTALELLNSQFKDAGTQLDNLFKGIATASLDHKTEPDGMSPREQIAHLGEAYSAVLAHERGAKYEWGSYTPKSTEMPALWDEIKALRAQATGEILKSGTDESLRYGADYIVAHDNYHIGRMVPARLACEPGWEPYSIYEGVSA